MPRRDIPDDGDDTVFQRNEVYMQNAADDPALQELEERLQDEVDEDLFEDPRRFNTLDRVIQVLGLQMMEGATEDLERNQAYQ